MNAHAALGAKVAVNLHRLCRVNVLLGQKPARLVGTNRNQCEVKTASPGLGVAVGKAGAGVWKIF